MLETTILIIGALTLASVPAILAFVILISGATKSGLPEFGMAALRALAVAVVLFVIVAAGLLVAVF